MIEIFDKEIKRLEELVGMAEDFVEWNKEYQNATASIPFKDVSDRLLRYATHYSREIERVLGQLERLQRARLGKPVPRFVVDVNTQ
jgi:hypothetical protein